jgi:hypothetical protein
MMVVRGREARKEPLGALGNERLGRRVRWEPQGSRGNDGGMLRARGGSVKQMLISYLVDRL